jgi:segregation and condensation protein B
MQTDSAHALETLLFLQGESITYHKLKALLGLTDPQLAQAKEDLLAMLTSSQSALTLIDNGESLQLGTLPAYTAVAERLIAGEYSDDLTDTQLEVLTIIAYRAPITRPAIDAIRGVNSSYTVRNLLIRGLIERKGNQEDARGYIYRVSNDFLATLGIRAPEELPEYEVLSLDPRFQEEDLLPTLETQYEE